MGVVITNVDVVATLEALDEEIGGMNDEKFNKEFRDLQAEVTQINTKVLQLEEALEILLEMKKHGRKNTRKSKRNGGKRK